MGTTSPESVHSSSDGVFIGLAFAMGGGVLMQTWLFVMHVGLPARLVGAVPWMSLGILAALRRRRATARAIGAPAEDTTPHSLSSSTGGAIVLLAAGGIIGALIVAEGAMGLMLFATACGFIPWQRVLLCKQQPGRASLVMCSGGTMVLGCAHNDVDVMFLPIAAWALGTSGLLTYTWTMRRQAVSKETDEERMSSNFYGYVSPRATGNGIRRGHTIGRRNRCRQDGAFAIMTVPLLILMVGVCGLALDLGQVYNRKADLGGFSKAVALAAARELNGTAAGIASARAKAKETAERLRYRNFSNGAAFTWNDAALTFSTAPSRTGTWGDGSAPAGLYFAKVDSAVLDASAGQVDTFLIGIFAPSLRTVQVTDSAVAGRKGVVVTPIALCAMDTTPAVARTNAGAPATELVEYGFRRGISYDLMQLNPNGTAPVRYLINPVVAPGVYSAAFDTSTVGPFICTGTMWVPRLTGGTVRVSSLPATSPLADLYAQLNTRFDDYSSLECAAEGAPPDYNIKAYAYNQSGGAPWMVPATGSAAVATTTSRGKLETIADLPTPPAGTAAGSYGPLWVFAKSVKYPSYVSLGSPEPDTGYATFSTSDWPNLYKLGPTASGYPSTSPYAALSGANYRAPVTSHQDVSTVQRRVLNIPLLACPVSTGANVPATIIGIGKFFMTVPANASTLIAEFAGALPEQSMSSQVELYP